MFRRLFSPLKGDPFNQALDQFRRLRYLSDDEQFMATSLEVVRLCQLAIQKKKSDGDAHVLLANAYFLAGLHMLGEGYRYCLPRAAAVIHEWKTNRLPTKNRANGEKVYQGILEALERPMPEWAGMSLEGDMGHMHKRYYYEAIDPEKTVELRKVVSAAYPTQTEDKLDADVSRHILLAASLREQGHLDGAIQELQEGLHLNPNSARLHSLLGTLHAEQGRLDEAIQELQAGLSLDPDDADAHFTLGTLYAQEGRWDRAIRELETVIRIDPDQDTVHFPLGTAYLRQGQLDEAIEEFQTGLENYPNDVDARFLLGRGYQRQGRLEDAISEYQAVLQINPDDARVHFTLGESYGEQGRLNEAIRELQAGLYVDPDNGDAHFLLSWFYAKRGYGEKAAQELQIAARLGSEQARSALQNK